MEFFMSGVTDYDCTTGFSLLQPNLACLYVKIDLIAMFYV